MAMDFGKLNFAVGFNRTSAFPLDANSYFEDYNAAVTAVAGAAEVGSADSAYYLGQIIIINDKSAANKGLGLYQITGTAGAGTLTKFGQATSADELGKRLTAIEGQITTINGKLVAATQLADGLMSKEDKKKLDLIADNAQVNTIEGVQVDGVDLTPDSNKKVNVALANTYLKKSDAESTYVAKEEGKGLSTNDYDAAAKAIVDGVGGKLEQKVDKVAGKGLSTNDYDAAAVAEVAKIKNKAETTVVEGINTRVTELEGKISGVTGAMHFKGVLTELPADLSAYEAGDVIVVDKKEYVCAASGTDGAKEWHELGDEGSHLTKDDAAKTYKTIASYNTEKATLEQNIQAAADAAAAEKLRAEGVEGELQTAINGKASSETVTALSGEVTAIKNDYLKAADKTELTTAIGKKADQTALDAATEAATVLTGRVDTIEGDYLKSTDKTELTNAIGEKAAQADLDTANGKITALETSVGKAAVGEEAATGLYKDIADEAAARQALATKVTANEGNIETLQTRVGTADDGAAADGSLFARVKQLTEDLNAGLAAAGKIDKITVNGEEVTIDTETKTAQIVLPAAFISSLAVGEDNLVVEEGKLKLAKVSTDKFVNGEKVLVLNGGSAND